ncbi:MAG TPA: rod shape-determining protein RodA [bacterium]|nr:rod shape-determining protein RodA [bacterium]
MNRRLLRFLDWPLLLVTLVLVAGGVVVLYSATQAAGTGPAFVKIRLIHAAVGLIALAILAATDYQMLASAWRPILVGTIVLLALVDVAGRSAMGAQRWISLGPLGGFQPSEVAKLALIIALAKLVEPRETWPWTAVGGLVLAAAVPAVLIVGQPDLGSTLVVVAIFAAVMFAGGAPARVLASLAVAGAAAVPLVWGLLRDYQRARLAVFLDPGIDPLGAGYALIQSKIAVGSGQLWGKGFLAGTQNLLHFIPEQHTDFIFTVIGEEFGFAGALIMLALFAVWVGRGLSIARSAKDRLGMLLAVGVVAMVAFHLFVNIGMTVGLMPITGIPLPFISHGGTALVVMLGSTGLLLSIGMRRKKILF